MKGFWFTFLFGLSFSSYWAFNERIFLSVEALLFSSICIFFTMNAVGRLLVDGMNAYKTEQKAIIIADNKNADE